MGRALLLCAWPLVRAVTVRVPDASALVAGYKPSQCQAIDPEKTDNKWCKKNCAGEPPYCPATLCVCSDGNEEAAPSEEKQIACVAALHHCTPCGEPYKPVGGCATFFDQSSCQSGGCEWLGDMGPGCSGNDEKTAVDDAWCVLNCGGDPPNCPTDKCTCEGGNPVVDEIRPPGMSKEENNAWTENEEKKQFAEREGVAKGMEKKREEAADQRMKDDQERMQETERKRKAKEAEIAAEADKRRQEREASVTERDESVAERYEEATKRNADAKADAIERRKEAADAASKPQPADAVASPSPVANDATSAAMAEAAAAMEAAKKAAEEAAEAAASRAAPTPIPRAAPTPIPVPGAAAQAAQGAASRPAVATPVPAAKPAVATPAPLPAVQPQSAATGTASRPNANGPRGNHADTNTNATSQKPKPRKKP